MKNCLGALDGTHIRVRVPLEINLDIAIERERSPQMY
jgi:hypothetical protein